MEMINNIQIDLNEAIELLQQANYYLCKEGRRVREGELDSHQLSDRIEDFIKMLENDTRKD